MGKTGRNAKHAEKMKRKRALKAARRTKYAALAGTSTKNKRQTRGDAPSGSKHAHAMSACGNVGCKRCFPELNCKPRRPGVSKKHKAA